VADTGDRDDFARIQKRDAQGNWFTIATTGSSPDETHWSRALTADGAGNLYVRDAFGIEKRAAQGDWSRIATLQADALATDTAGNLYVASRGGLQKRDAQGNWSVIAAQGTDIGQVVSPTAVAVDTRGNLLVSDVVGGECGGASYVRIQKRDPQGNWSVIATFQFGTEFSVIDTFVCALAVDTAGNLYVAYGYALGDGNGFHYEIARRDAQGNWSVIATERSALGQVTFADGGALAVDAASNLYVVDDDAYQVQKYTLAR
jgi:ligand-binding sensor domain-containing protein